MAGSGEQMTADFVDINRQVAEALGRVNEIPKAALGGKLADSLHRLDGASDIGSMGQRNQLRPRRDGSADVVRINIAVSVTRDVRRCYVAVLGQEPKRPENRIVLTNRGDDV